MAQEKVNPTECVPVLKVLSDESRWRIVAALLHGPLTVNELAARLSLTQYNVSKHLRLLREAGIIEMIAHGRHKECRVAAAFRQRISRQNNCLDLGCCTFRFE